MPSGEKLRGGSRALGAGAGTPATVYEVMRRMPCHGRRPAACRLSLTVGAWSAPPGVARRGNQVSGPRPAGPGRARAAGNDSCRRRPHGGCRPMACPRVASCRIIRKLVTVWDSSELPHAPPVSRLGNSWGRGLGFSHPLVSCVHRCAAWMHMYHQIESAADISQLLQVQFICRATPTGVHGQQGMETDGQESYRGALLCFFYASSRKAQDFALTVGACPNLRMQCVTRWLRHVPCVISMVKLR